MVKGGLDEGSSDDEGGPPETRVELVALPPFKNLYRNSPIVQMALEFGKNSIPLSAVGMLLNYAGNHLLKYIDAVFGKRIFFPLHTVVSLTLMPNGEILTTSIKKEVSIILDPNRK